MGEGLDAFVKNNGWATTDFENINFQSRSPRSKVAFLQSLLNIALVIEFLSIRGVRASNRDFIRDGSFLDTSALPSLVDSMSLKETDLDPVVKENQAARMKSLFEFAERCTSDQIWRNSDEVFLGIACMMVTLSRLARLLRIVPEGHRLKVSGQGGQHGLPIETLFEAGWCPRQISELYSSTNPLTLSYITTLRRDHSIGSHENCTPSKCVNCQVDSETYVTKHTSTCSGCDHILVDAVAVTTCIAQGIVPRLSVDYSADCPTISVTDKGPYTAISHVWAHGRRFPNTLFIIR